MVNIETPPLRDRKSDIPAIARFFLDRYAKDNGKAIESIASQALDRLVSYDGTGIPLDVLPRIYEPFFSTKEGGTGMGMSIVHSLVALHHGSIHVASSPTGTTFQVAVPRRQLTPA